jgi:GTP cyclohydrolase I
MPGSPARRVARLRAPRRVARLRADPEAAVARFLDGLGLPGAVRDGPELRDTPRRVAEAWLAELVDGYRLDPAAVLAESMPATSRGLVTVTGLDYHSVCPHHLLPSRGVAHVAYVPGSRVVGFGQLGKLVDCLAHRLVLQEDLAQQIADALVTHLGARGAACLLDAEQLCLTVRGEKRARSRTHAEAFAGSLAGDAALQRRFLAAVTRAAPERTPGRARR